MELQEAIHNSRMRIKVGSLSFALASQLFDRQTRDAAHCLYSWCRHCDDFLDGVDQRLDLNTIEKKALKAAHLEELRQKTTSAMRGERQTDPVFLAFQYAVTAFRIPEQYPLDLLDGMEMDALGFEYRTQADLELYCYRVAGVVGLMMVHIMGINNEKALIHAVCMGNAMQMTNIARDINEDFEMGRIYLPQVWLTELEINPQTLMQDDQRANLVRAVERLLQLARDNYVQGYKGLQFLPFRASFAVAAAGEVYSTIGAIVRRRGTEAWKQRAIVSLPRKLLAVARGLFRVLKIIPGRVFRPWSRQSIGITWRPL